MAKQTFTTGQVLTAAQMTSLQQTAMLGGAATAKTASYILAASDAGTSVVMNSAVSTTITVNSGLFAAGDTVFIQNFGVGICTVTAGTATVSNSGLLDLPQNDAGILYFISASSAVFYDFVQDPGTGDVTLNGTQTLTNKTLTSPVLGGTTTTASGNLVIEPASYIVEIKGGGSTVGQIQLNCPVNTHGQIIASQPHSESATNVLTLPGGTAIGNSNAVLVSDIGIQTLTNKTLADSIIRGIKEDVNVVAAAATGTIDFDVETASIWYYTLDATGNFTLNFRFSSSVTLNTALATGDAITLVFLNTNGATPYYPNVINIDGSAVTPKVTASITGGNASAIDIYTFTIIKTASATFTVFETQTKFA